MLLVQQGETKMQLKQTSQEYSRNIAAFGESIKPAVLASTPSNGQYMSGWLLKNCTDANGSVDASVDNLRRACSALHAVGQLEWTVAPNQKKQRDDARTDSAPSQDVVKEAVEKFDARVEQEAFAACKSIIASYRGRVHSITYKSRDILQAKFDELLANKTKPTAIKAALEVMVGNFPN